MVRYTGDVAQDLQFSAIQQCKIQQSNRQQFDIQNSSFIEVYEVVDSTNDQMRRALEALITCQYRNGFQGLVCADQQTAGRGQMDRQWVSPKGSNIYASFGFTLQQDQQLHGLSLVVGLALRSSIMSLTGLHTLALKWPNDLYAGQAKVAGILIEVFQAYGYWQLIIGIGVNVNQRQTHVMQQVDQPWTSLALELGQDVHRAELITVLTENLCLNVAQFSKHGWPCFQQQWRAADWLYGRVLRVQTRAKQSIQQPIVGEAQGVDQQGLLQVRDQLGQTHLILSGDITLL